MRITPELGTQPGGNYAVRPASAIHDELYAKALVLETGAEKAALVVDVVTIDRDTVDTARGMIALQTGIGGQRVMIRESGRNTRSASTGAGGETRGKVLFLELEKACECWMWSR